MRTTTKDNSPRHRRRGRATLALLSFAAAMFVVPAVASAQPATASPASTPDAAAQQASTAAIASDFECGFLRCSYVFSKANTNIIADEGLDAGDLCELIPTPGNVACAASLAVMVGTAKVAKSRGQCLKVTWVNVVSPVVIGYPSVDGGSRCK